MDSQSPLDPRDLPKAIPQLPPSPLGCPIDSLLRLISGPWTTYLLWNLYTGGPTRFGELKRKMGTISAKVLTERLRMLEQAGVIYRHLEPTVPPQVTYGLTDKGDELITTFEPLAALARRWAGLPEDATCSKGAN